MKRAYSLLNVKSVTESDGSWKIRGIASTPVSDRMGDIVEPLGAKFQLPMPLLWQHDASQPVGQVEFAKATKEGIPYEATIPKVSEPGRLKDRIDEAVQSIKYKLVAAVSIGFRAIEGQVEMIKGGGLRFNEWEWLELSLVTIPANPEATITGIKSIDSALRAANGKTAGAVGSNPGAPGVSTSFSKGVKMKTLQELLEAREHKAARMTELANLREAESRKSTDEEAAEFDALADDVQTLDDEIRTMKAHQVAAGSAREVRGQTAKEASASRGRSPSFYIKNEDPDDAFAGQSYIRGVIARAAAFVSMKNGDYKTPAQIAAHRWGKTNPKLVEFIRAGVAGGGTGSGEWGAELAQSDTRYTGDFVDYLYSLTVFDRLALRSVPARVHIKGQDGAATGYWVGESKATPVSKPDFSDVELTPLKVGALASCSKELVMDSSPSAEMWIRDSIANASAQRVDTTFLGAGAAVAGVSPAGILNGLTGQTPSGTDAAAIRADLNALYAPFIAAKNAGGLVQIMTPSMAKTISLMVNALGQTEFAGLNANGGTLLGDTVYTGDNVTAGDWILMKPSDVWKIGDGGLEVSMSDQATIEQDSAPTGEGDTPTAASATLISLWQAEMIGFKVTRHINYAKRRASAVAFATGCAYAL